MAVELELTAGGEGPVAGTTGGAETVDLTGMTRDDAEVRSGCVLRVLTLEHVLLPGCCSRWRPGCGHARSAASGCVKAAAAAVADCAWPRA